MTRYRMDHYDSIYVWKVACVLGVLSTAVCTYSHKWFQVGSEPERQKIVVDVCGGGENVLFPVYSSSGRDIKWRTRGFLERHSVCVCVGCPKILLFFVGPNVYCRPISHRELWQSWCGETWMYMCSWHAPLGLLHLLSCKYVQKFDGVGVGALVHFAVMGGVLPSSRSLPAGSPDLHHLLSPRDHSVHWHQQSAWGRKPWQ